MNTPESLKLKKASIVLTKVATSDLPKGITCGDLVTYIVNDNLVGDHFNMSNNGTNQVEMKETTVSSDNDGSNKQTSDKDQNVIKHKEEKDAKTSIKRRKTNPTIYTRSPICTTYEIKKEPKCSNDTMYTAVNTETQFQTLKEPTTPNSLTAANVGNSTEKIFKSSNGAKMTEIKIPQKNLEIKNAGTRLIVGTLKKPKSLMTGKINKIAEKLLNHRQQQFFKGRKTVKYYNKTEGNFAPGDPTRVAWEESTVTKPPSIAEIQTDQNEGFMSVTGKNAFIKVEPLENDDRCESTFGNSTVGLNALIKTESTDSDYIKYIVDRCTIKSAKEKTMPNILSRSKARRSHTAPSRITTNEQDGKNYRCVITSNDDIVDVNTVQQDLEAKHGIDSPKTNDITVKGSGIQRKKYCKSKQDVEWKPITSYVHEAPNTLDIPMTKLHSFPYLTVNKSKRLNMLKSPKFDSNRGEGNTDENVHVKFEPVDAIGDERRCKSEAEVAISTIQSKQISPGQTKSQSEYSGGIIVKAEKVDSPSDTSSPFQPRFSVIGSKTALENKNTDKLKQKSVFNVKERQGKFAKTIATFSKKKVPAITYAEYCAQVEAMSYTKTQKGANDSESPASTLLKKLTHLHVKDEIKTESRGNNAPDDTDGDSKEDIVHLFDHGYTKTPDSSPSKDASNGDKTSNESILAMISKRSGQVSRSIVSTENIRTKKKTPVYAVKYGNKLFLIPGNDGTYTKESQNLIAKESQSLTATPTDDVKPSSTEMQFSTSPEVSSSNSTHEPIFIPKISSSMLIRKSKKKRVQKKRLSKNRQVFAKLLRLVGKDESRQDNVDDTTPSARAIPTIGRRRHGAGTVYKTPFIKHADVALIKISNGNLTTFTEKVVISLTNGSDASLKSWHRFTDIRARLTYEDLEGTALRLLEVDDILSGFYHISESDVLTDENSNKKIVMVNLTCLPAHRDVMEDGESYIVIGTLANLFCSATSVQRPVKDVNNKDIEYLFKSLLPSFKRFQGHLDVSESSYHPKVHAAQWYSGRLYDCFTRKHCKARKFDERIKYERKQFGSD